MSRKLLAHFLPELFAVDDLRDSIAVVIDILRASTTITQALVNGAEAVIPCLNIEDALKYKAQHPEAALLLGGERAGKKIEGFDLDNSPLKYTSETVQGKTILFTSTNGTKALHRCALADTVLIGAFSNLSAITARLLKSTKSIHLVCAGTDGEVTAEDVLFAGAVVNNLLEQNASAFALNDSATIASQFAREHLQSEASLLEGLFSSRGGKNLLKLGFQADIAQAARRDLFDCVPEFHVEENRITA